MEIHFQLILIIMCDYVTSVGVICCHFYKLSTVNVTKFRLLSTGLKNMVNFKNKLNSVQYLGKNKLEI